MRIARIEIDGIVYLARVESAELIVLLQQESAHPAADALREGLARGVDLQGDGIGKVSDGYRLLAPVRHPSKFFGVGLNYEDHARESGQPIPDKPTFFLKTPNAIIGPDEPIHFDWDVTDAVDIEVELALVIGRTVPAGEATRPQDAILGYTVCNDVTARDAQLSDVQWPRSKCFDSFAPLGPWIVTTDSLDPGELHLWSDLSGERMQDASTSGLVFGPEELVAYLNRSITLEPGDVITTGTPAGVGFTRNPPRLLRHGDLVTVGIEGIGAISNPVVAVGPRSGGRV